MIFFLHKRLIQNTEKNGSWVVIFVLIQKSGYQVTFLRVETLRADKWDKLASYNRGVVSKQGVGC